MHARQPIDIRQPETRRLIRNRAKRLGLRGDQLEDAVQQVAADLMTFRFDPEKANGARASTVLVAVADRALLHLLRTEKRYRERNERALARVRQTSVSYNHGLAADVRQAVAALSGLEQRICFDLGQGRTKREIAETLGCAWYTVDRLIGRIRRRFRRLGLDEWLRG